jgi:esterase/lipase superfamily enzyme
VQTDDIQRRRAIRSIIQIEDVLGRQGPNKGKRSTGYFVMDEAGVINGVVTLSGDFDLDRFILRRATVDFDQRFQRQII